MPALSLSKAFAEVRMSNHPFADTDAQGGDDRSAGTAAPACPDCGSHSVTSASKEAGANSYWRCLDCGQMWCPARRSSTVARRWPR